MKYPLNNVNYVTDIWWQINDDQTKTPTRKNVIKEFHSFLSVDNIDKSEFNYDYLVRTIGQYGFYDANEFIKNKQYSLASSLAFALKDFCGILNLHGKYWAIKCQNGMVVSDTDKIFNSFSSAEEHLLKFCEKKEDITVLEDDTETAEYLASLKMKPIGLIEPIQKSLFTKTNVTILMAILACIGFYIYYHVLDIKEQQYIAQMEIIKQKKIDKDILDAQNNSSKFFERPYEEYLPEGNRNFLDFVVNDLLTYSPHQNGWVISKVTYTKDNRKILWSGAGDFLDLPQNAKVQGETVISDTPIKISWKSSTSIAGELNKADLLQRYLYSITARSGVNLSVSFKKTEKKIVRFGKKEIQLIAPWQIGDFSIANVSFNVLSNNNFKKVLSIYGLLIEQVDFENNLFTIRGKIYVQQ